ncbi:hypothetical protein [Novosphingobium sp. PhB165]|uniref:hypothetical protein n=1 Tax=Novosphingobium sp. PhB165 TaxID=2485105 RepID=UPI0014053A85|nr:hypothetical protein [Novosphingobium sp. PhB165]
MGIEAVGRDLRQAMTAPLVYLDYGLLDDSCRFERGGNDPVVLVIRDHLCAPWD